MTSAMAPSVQMTKSTLNYIRGFNFLVELLTLTRRKHAGTVSHLHLVGVSPNCNMCTGMRRFLLTSLQIAKTIAAFVSVF